MKAKILRTALLGLLGPLALVPTAPADSVKHYRHLLVRESSVEDLKGRHEIDARAPKQLLHHRIRRDGAWCIQRYAWERPPPSVIVEMRINKKGESEPLRPYFPFHRVRLDFGHNDLLDRITPIDAQGQIATSPTGAALDRISYGPWGNLHRWQVYDLQSRPHNGHAPDMAMGEHVHDGPGQARLLRGFGPHGEDRAMAGLHGPMSFECDRHGSLARQELRAMHGEMKEGSRLEYRADGSRLLFVRHFDAKGRSTNPACLPPALVGRRALQFQYDERGLRSAPIRYGADGKPLPAPQCAG